MTFCGTCWTGLRVWAASNAVAEAEKLVADFGNVRVVSCDVQDLAKISGLVEEADVVIR